MSSGIIITIIVAYFLLLIGISFITGKSDSNESFFLGNKQSLWYVVAFGMIGNTISGITFISVPGKVQASHFAYMQMTLGFFVGFFVIAKVLLPLYYRLNLISIYGYLQERFGNFSYKTGASFFLISRTIGASLRLYVMANVLQMAVFDAFHVPFWGTVLLTILLIWVYTFRSGIKTIVWTDTFQTFFLLLATGLSIYFISNELNFSFVEMVSVVSESEFSRVFHWEGNEHFLKQFFAGVFMVIVMTGLDQDMMQKNLSCKNLKEAQKNMYWFSFALLFVNFLFLFLGALLYMYADKVGIVVTKDDLFPAIALSEKLGWSLGVFFILGLVAAAYSSADSALTSLTTSFCVDILDFEKMKNTRHQILSRKLVHLLFSLILFVVILIIKSLNNDSVIDTLFTLAGYTYGPLLGLYAFGLYTRLNINDKWVPFVAIISPLLTYLINTYSEELIGYKFGFELLILNGLITFLGCLFFSIFQKNKNANYTDTE